ncbi:hypothetical protein HDV00_009699, partial [Rhizophlyctis rosea]
RRLLILSFAKAEFGGLKNIRERLEVPLGRRVSCSDWYRGRGARMIAGIQEKGVNPSDRQTKQYAKGVRTLLFKKDDLSKVKRDGIDHPAANIDMRDIWVD